MFSKEKKKKNIYLSPKILHLNLEAKACLLTNCYPDDNNCKTFCFKFSKKKLNLEQLDPEQLLAIANRSVYECLCVGLMLPPLSQQDTQQPPQQGNAPCGQWKPPPLWPTGPGNHWVCRVHSPSHLSPAQSPHTHRHHHRNSIDWAHLHTRERDRA